MKGKRRILARCAAALCALWICAALMAPMAAQTTQDTQTEKSTKAKKHKKSTATGSASRAAPVTNASPAEIQTAKSNGDVWVNTDSGVYHKSGKWYGATKNGKFMSEQDAIKSGYKLAKNEK